MNKLVVKDNSLINASYNLCLVEQRLILLSIIEARENGKVINANEPLTIYAENYAKQFSVSRQASYLALKDACKHLFERKFSYQETRGKEIININSRWVSQIGYLEDKAIVQLIFSPAIVPLITQLEKQFTKYDIEQISNLSSAYAIRLYELLMCWRSTGKTPIINLEEFRQKMGVMDKAYQHMHDLKKNVLEISIHQINKYTDITAKYEQYKQGRTITGFSFTFTQKQKSIESKKVNNWQTKGLTDAQIAKIACNLKQFVDANNNKIAPNDHRDYASIFKAWKALLKNSKNVNEFKDIQKFLDI